jgi:hypothetical protein
MKASYWHATLLRRRLVWMFILPLVGCAGTVDAADGAAGTASAPFADKRAGWLEVWVLLSLPGLASLPREPGPEHEALRERILLQQDQVMAGLRELGAVELARVQWVRNALAVRLPAAQVPAARGLPGVLSVRAVRNQDRVPPLPPRV